MLEPTREPFVPLWGTVTALALHNSPGSGLRLRDLPDFLRAYAEVKLAAVHANRDLGVLDGPRAKAIAEAAAEMARGELLDHFPLRVIPTGASTATNMNVNEVLAARAMHYLPRGTQITIHPNDHVNRSQSSNDTYPTAAKILFVRQALEVATCLRAASCSFARLADANTGTERMGRTSWQDAVVVPISAMHRAHAAVADRLADEFEGAARQLQSVQLGGTVLGTGVGAHKEFGRVAVEHLANITGLPMRRSDSCVDSFVHTDGYAALADTAARCASILYKQCQDLRILSSGPNGGLSELTLPRLQPGSSIMPGKVNPVVPNLVVHASFSIRAAALSVALAVASGDPDNNGNGPAVVASLSPALTEAAAVIRVLVEKCLDGLRWNPGRLAELGARSFDARIEDAASEGYDEIAGRSI